MANDHEQSKKHGGKHGESSRLSPRTSTHRYKKATPNKPRDRAPTSRDMEHIKDNVQHRAPSSSRWVFEKGIYNASNNGIFERILHLLTLIDENGNIQEVRVPESH